MCPDLVQDALHVLGPGCCGDHRVLLGEDNAELPVGPVAAVTMPGHPKLEPVTLPPVGIRFLRVLDLESGRLGDPLLRQQPLTIPDSTLEVQQPKPGDRVRSRVQSRVPKIATGDVLLPAGLNDAERVEETGPRS